MRLNFEMNWKTDVGKKDIGGREKRDGTVRTPSKIIAHGIVRPAEQNGNGYHRTFVQSISVSPLFA
jgi:hypothetical protein